MDRVLMDRVQSSKVFGIGKCLFSRGLEGEGNAEYANKFPESEISQNKFKKRRRKKLVENSYEKNSFSERRKIPEFFLIFGEEVDLTYFNV